MAGGIKVISGRILGPTGKPLFNGRGEGVVGERETVDASLTSVNSGGQYRLLDSTQADPTCEQLRLRIEPPRVELTNVRLRGIRVESGSVGKELTTLLPAEKFKFNLQPGQMVEIRVTDNPMGQRPFLRMTGLR
jgi:hypothetical protein